MDDENNPNFRNESIEEAMNRISSCFDASSDFANSMRRFAKEKPREFSALMEERSNTGSWFRNDGSIGGFVDRKGSKRHFIEDENLKNTVDMIALRKRRTCLSSKL